ncbi:MAG: hypothetical protein ACJAZ3_000446 [Sphingobacteriales bacterium]|jgi:hypothetical protein
MNKILLIAAISFSIILGGCLNTENADNFKFKIKPETKASISGQFINAASGKNITKLNGDVTFTGDADVVVTVMGKDAGKIVNVTGVTKAIFDTKGGFLNFGVNPGETVSPSTPIEIILVAKATGYLTTSLPLRITDSESTNFVIKMVKIGENPKGVGATSSTTGSSSTDGTVENEIIVSASTTGSSSGEVNSQVNIPKGTIITNASGDPLTGQLTVNLVYFNNQEQSALEAFPGGFEANVVGASGTTLFTTGGFLALEVEDENGKVASSFSNDISITMEVPAGTINPKTGIEVAANDQIPILSYNTLTGEWTNEKTGTLVLNGNGNFDVIFGINHLSYWNLDWTYGVYCSEGLSIRFTSNLDETCNGSWRKILLSDVNDQPIRSSFIQLFNGNEITFYNAPQIAAKLKIYDADGINVISTTEIADLCGTQEVSINIDAAEVGGVTMSVKAECQDLVIVPSFSVWFRKQGSSNWRSGYVREGNLTLCDVEIPGTYIFGAYYDNQFYTQEFTINEKNTVIDLDQLDVSEEVCSFLEKE